MNERLSGWRLALALLIPAAVIGAAAWFAILALSDDDGQDLAVSEDDVTATAVPTATSLPETAPLAEPSEAAEPTAIELPTAGPTAAPAATMTPAPTEAPAAQPTSPPATTAPQPTSPPSTGPTSTPTPDPDVIVVTCVVDDGFPSRLAVGESFGPLKAGVTPDSAAANLRHVWNLGDGRTAGAAQTGVWSYAAEGRYTVTLTSTDATTGVEVSAITCGEIRVGGAGGDGNGDGDTTIRVSCSVSPATPGVTFDDATLNDPMTVTVTWRPRDIILNLQYEFETNDPIVFSNGASSGDSQTNEFLSEASSFKIFWRYPETGETGRVECPAFPESDDPDPTPEPTAAATATPTATATATVDPTPTPTPTPTATTDPT